MDQPVRVRLGLIDATSPSLLPDVEGLLNYANRTPGIFVSLDNG